jgi:hypothetical protein
LVEGFPSNTDDIKMYLQLCSKLQGIATKNRYCVTVIDITFSGDVEELILVTSHGFFDCLPFPRDEETGKLLRLYLVNVIPRMCMTHDWPPVKIYKENEIEAYIYPVQIMCKEWPLKPFIYSDTFKKSNVFDAVWSHKQMQIKNNQ